MLYLREDMEMNIGQIIGLILINILVVGCAAIILIKWRIFGWVNCILAILSIPAIIYFDIAMLGY